MGATSRRHAPITRVSRRRCWRGLRVTEAAATTESSPMSARACWRGWPAAPTRASCPGARSWDPARLPLIDRVPELPEVETIRRQLAPHLEGRTLQKVEILDARWTRPDAPWPIQDALRGRVVQEV